MTGGEGRNHADGIQGKADELVTHPDLAAHGTHELNLTSKGPPWAG